MLVRTNKTTKSGRTIYVNALTGQEAPPPYSKPNRGGRIPDGVYHRFIKPAPSKFEN